MPFSLLNPWVLLATLCLSLASFGGGYWKGGQDAEAAHAKQELLIAKVAETAQQAAAQEISKIEIHNTVIRQKVQREILEKPVYSQCAHSPDGLRLTNQALAGGPVTSGGGELSGDAGRTAR